MTCPVEDLYFATYKRSLNLKFTRQQFKFFCKFSVSNSQRRGTLCTDAVSLLQWLGVRIPLRPFPAVIPSLPISCLQEFFSCPIENTGTNDKKISLIIVRERLSYFSRKVCRYLLLSNLSKFLRCASKWCHFLFAYQSSSASLCKFTHPGSCQCFVIL